MRWNRRKVFISSALRLEDVELDRDGDRYWNVRWGAIPLGRLDDDRPQRGLIVPRRPRGSANVSAMSLL